MYEGEISYAEWAGMVLESSREGIGRSWLLLSIGLHRRKGENEVLREFQGEGGKCYDETEG